jgi:hypothetical protein
MVQADICRTAAKSLVSDSLLFTVLAFHFFRHGNSSVLLFIDTFPDPPDGGKQGQQEIPAMYPEIPLYCLVSGTGL